MAETGPPIENLEKDQGGVKDNKGPEEPEIDPKEKKAEDKAKKDPEKDEKDKKAKDKDKKAKDKDKKAKDKDKKAKDKDKASKEPFLKPWKPNTELRARRKKAAIKMDIMGWFILIFLFSLALLTIYLDCWLTN